MALRKNLKISYYGFLGFLGLLGFEDPWYFLFFLFFLFFFVRRPVRHSFSDGGSPGEGGFAPTGKSSRDLIEKQTQEKEEHMQKVREFINTKDKVCNDDIQKLLSVSDATAERYLNELEKSGVLRQVGRTGQSVFYSKQ